MGIVAGNWKMHGSKAMVVELLTKLKQGISNAAQKQCLIFPPALYLPLVQELLGDSYIAWGIQNVYPACQGAYTGELSVSMAKEYGATYGLVGHSERRQLFGESNQFVAQKFHHIKENAIIPILCVGETLAEREQGMTEAVIRAQLEAVLAQGSLSGSIIAYEPVWAIGTGKTAQPEHAQSVHASIRRVIAEKEVQTAQAIRILYGGSVNETNAEALFGMPDIDGGLVGGASLNADKFVEIVKCIK